MSGTAYAVSSLTGAQYKTYKSPYGPKYAVLPNVSGWTARSFTKLGMTLGAFGGVAGFFALFFLGEVPRVRRDILSKVPGIGPHFIREIPASDNVRRAEPPDIWVIPAQFQYKAVLCDYSSLSKLTSTVENGIQVRLAPSVA